MKKSIFCWVLVLAFVFCTFPINALTIDHVEEMDMIDTRVAELVNKKIVSLDADISVSAIKNLYDYVGNTYKLAECQPTGYFILNPDAGIFVEYSVEANSPYMNLDGLLYYFGPTFYYTNKGITDKPIFTHTQTNEVLTNINFSALEDICVTTKNNLMEESNSLIINYLHNPSFANSVNTTLSLNASSTYWVNGYTYFQNLGTDFGYIGVNGGACGYIAANILLKYWDNRGYINLPSSAYESTTALTRTLMDMSPNHPYSYVSDGYTVRDVINEYCSANNITEAATGALADYSVAEEIMNSSKRRPAILFGSIPKSEDSEEMMGHAVIAYGRRISDDGNGYICHYGYQQMENADRVFVSDSVAIWGSNTKFNP